MEIDGNSVLLMLGKLQGQMDGHGRELGEIKSEIHGIKEMFRCEGEDCEECRKEIDNRIEATGKRIEKIEHAHTGQDAVRSWIDHRVVQYGLLAGVVVALIGLALQVAGVI